MNITRVSLVLENSYENFIRPKIDKKKAQLGDVYIVVSWNDDRWNFTVGAKKLSTCNSSMELSSTAAGNLAHGNTTLFYTAS